MLVRFTYLIILHKECVLGWTLQDAELLHTFQSLYFDFLIVDAEVWCVAHLVEYLFSVYKALTLIPALHKTFMFLWHHCNFSTWEAKVRRIRCSRSFSAPKQVQGQPELQETENKIESKEMAQWVKVLTCASMRT